MEHTFDHHPPCPGGCGELADECRCPRPNPLGSMQIDRDADNVPSDRVRAYAEAMRYTRWMSADSRVSAVMAVADREQAALLAEIARVEALHDSWAADAAANPHDQWDPVMTVADLADALELDAALRDPEPTEDGA